MNFRACLRCVLLVLVVQAARDRVMRVVHLGHEVGDRELQAIGDDAQALVARRQLELRPEIEKNVGRLRDDEVAVLQKGRRVGRVRPVAFQLAHHRADSLAVLLFAARDVHVGRLRLFQREPHEFAPALQTVPVIEFVCHRSSPCFDRRVFHGLRSGRPPGGQPRTVSLATVAPGSRVARVREMEQVGGAQKRKKPRC